MSGHEDVMERERALFESVNPNANKYRNGTGYSKPYTTLWAGFIQRARIERTMKPTTAPAPGSAMTRSPADVLLPCPFCGEATHVWPRNEQSSWHAGGYARHVQCSSCKAIGPDASTESAAIGLWNRRAALAKPLGPRTPDNSMVICPKCTNQFRAISVDDQKRSTALDRDATPTGELKNVHVLPNGLVIHSDIASEMGLDALEGEGKAELPPCQDCGAKDFPDWTLLPHERFNEVCPDGNGYLCLLFFAKRLLYIAPPVPVRAGAGPRAEFEKWCGLYCSPGVMSSDWYWQIWQAAWNRAATAPTSWWRPEVVTFADLMERELRNNDHKGGWKGCAAGPLLDRVYEELNELRDALFSYPRDTLEYRRKIAEEAADVANMAMMVVDVCDALPPPPAKEPSDG